MHFKERIHFEFYKKNVHCQFLGKDGNIFLSWQSVDNFISSWLMFDFNLVIKLVQKNTKSLHLSEFLYNNLWQYFMKQRELDYS